MKAVLFAALGLLAQTALAAPTLDSPHLDVAGVKCNLTNAAGVAEIKTGGRERGQISTVYGNVPVTGLDAAYSTGILKIDVTYTSRIYWGQPVTVSLYLWAPGFESGQTVYGTLFAQIQGFFLTPPGPFSGGGTYMDPLHGWVPQHLPIGFVPVAVASCQVNLR